MSEKVLAVAAGHEITEEELDVLVKNYPQQQQMYMSPEQLKEQALEQLIAFHLFAKMAEDEKIVETDEYKNMIEKMKVELASHMAATQTIESVKVEEGEAKEYYEKNQSQFEQSPQVSAKHILVEDEETAEKVAKEIAEGKDFSEAAKEYSSCPSKDRGGDLGYFSKGQMVPEFEKAAFEGELNKVIGPVKTQFGYHLILVADKKEGSVIPFEEVDAQIRQRLLQTKQQEAYMNKVSELTEKYGVEKK